MRENAIPRPVPPPQPGPRAPQHPPAPDRARKDLASRIAERSLAKRGTEYANEVRRLLDAALEVIERHGTDSRPRVADIVAAAGLSNDAFYRHFGSKDALVAALLEDGTERLTSYVGHQMDKEPSAEGQVRRWVEGVLSQTQKDIAATTLAVLWNGGSIGASRSHDASAPLAALLRASLTALGSADPDMDASLAAHATLGKVSEYLWAGRTATAAEVDQIVDFVLAAARRRSGPEVAASGP